FFFQAEDGIRDLTVTGVQTCALPIYGLAFGISWGVGGVGLILGTILPSFPLDSHNPLWYLAGYGPTIAAIIVLRAAGGWAAVRRSEERRVGKEGGDWVRVDHYNNNGV